MMAWLMMKMGLSSMLSSTSSRICPISQGLFHLQRTRTSRSSTSSSSSQSPMVRAGELVALVSWSRKSWQSALERWAEWMVRGRKWAERVMGWRLPFCRNWLKLLWNCLIMSCRISSTFCPRKEREWLYLSASFAMYMTFSRVSSDSRRVLCLGKLQSYSSGRRMSPPQQCLSSICVISLTRSSRIVSHSLNVATSSLTLLKSEQIEQSSSCCLLAVWMLAVCLRFRVCFSICSRIFWYSPWLQQMSRQTAVSQNSASRPVGCSCRRSWVSVAKSCSMSRLLEKQSLSTAGLRMLLQGRSFLRSYCLMICCTFSNFWFLCACLKRNDPLSFASRSSVSLSLAGSGSKPGSLSSSVSLSMSARPYSWRSQYMSHLTLGRKLLHSPPRSRQQTHSSTSLQKKLLTSLPLSAQARWMCLMAAMGSMRCAQASAWLTCGTSCERPACSQASAAEAYRSSWQQMLPELTMISFASGQFSSQSRKEQMARSVSAVARKLLSCLPVALSCRQKSSAASMRKCSRLSSSSSRCDCCWALSSCNCANASEVALSFAGPCSWASASRIIQSVRQSSLVSGLKEASFSSLARMFWKYWAASGQLPFSQRQQPMLQESVQLSGSISAARLYSSRALLRFPVSSKPSPSSVQSLAEAQALRSTRLSEMNSQCLTDSSKRPLRLSTLPSALWVSRLSLWKGSSASPLPKCAQQMRRASWRKRSSSSPRLRHSISLRLCLSRSLSLSPPIFSSACCSSPDSISRMPSASVMNISSSQSTGRSGSKDSKMLSILASAAFCADFLRARLLMEPSQSFELCSQFLASLRQWAICWLISSAMSQSLRWSSSLSSSRLRCTLAVELSRKTESLWRLSLAMRLPARWSTRWKRACASSARSWQNLWKALEFLVSMELRRQMARLKAASGSWGSMARTLRQLLMAWSVCPSFLQQMPMLMRELRQRGLVVSAASMMKSYSLMASSFWPLMRQRLARLQWLIASAELIARAVRQQRLASTYLPSARQQQPMLQQAWKQLGLKAAARMQLSMALSKLLAACCSLPRRKQSSAFCVVAARLWLLAEASLILRDWGRSWSSAFISYIMRGMAGVAVTIYEYNGWQKRGSSVAAGADSGTRVAEAADPAHALRHRHQHPPALPQPRQARPLQQQPRRLPAPRPPPLPPHPLPPRQPPRHPPLHQHLHPRRRTHPPRPKRSLDHLLGQQAPLPRPPLRSQQHQRHRLRPPPHCPGGKNSPPPPPPARLRPQHRHFPPPPQTQHQQLHH